MKNQITKERLEIETNQVRTARFCNDSDMFVFTKSSYYTIIDVVVEDHFRDKKWVVTYLQTSEHPRFSEPWYS